MWRQIISMNSGGIGAAVAVAWRMISPIDLVVVALASSPRPRRRQIWATQCQR